MVSYFLLIELSLSVSFNFSGAVTVDPGHCIPGCKGILLFTVKRCFAIVIIHYTLIKVTHIIIPLYFISCMSLH